MPETRPFDLLWDYSDPAGTEATFRALLPDAPDEDYRLELLTQIARTHSLRKQFDEAHALLDEVDASNPQGVPLVRALLERGRTLNSAGKPNEAKPLFMKALEVARAVGADFFAVDAAHMIAIVAPSDEQEEWNRKAIGMATASSDERTRGWLGSLANNLGWSYHAQGRYDEALECFEQALEARLAQGKEEPTRIARWCVARAMRSLGRIEDALHIQQDLANFGDPYVDEELGECLLALGRAEDAKPHFAKAYEALRPELENTEPERLERLRSLS